MVVVSAQQIDDRMRIGAGRQSCNRPSEACTYDVRDVRWMDVRYAMNHVNAEGLVGIGGLPRPSHTRTISAHFPQPTVALVPRPVARHAHIPSAPAELANSRTAEGMVRGAGRTGRAHQFGKLHTKPSSQRGCRR